MAFDRCRVSQEAHAVARRSSIEADTAAVLAEVMRGLSLEPVQGREGVSLSPEAIRAAAEGLLTLSERTFAALTQRRAALVTSVATAVTPREAAPGLADRWRRRAADRVGGEGGSADRAVAQQREAFLQRYWKLRPPHLKTQADVARAAGVHVNTIVGIEKGRARPHYGTIVKLAKAFGVSPEELAPIP